MRRSVVCLTAASLLLIETAMAQETKYNWVGYGRGTVQTPNCGKYKMTIGVTVANGRVAGLFQQDGRPQRNFNIPLQANGVFKGEALVGEGNKMSVSGRISGDSGEILLDGYCKFGGTLRKT